jgi:hypothetical protein
MTIRMLQDESITALVKVENDVEQYGLELCIETCRKYGYDGLLFAHGLDYEGRWCVDIADDGYLRLTERMIDVLKSEGCKRIAVVCCNPGGYDIAGVAWYAKDITNVGCFMGTANSSENVVLD